MILKKVILDGKEAFIPIGIDEALRYENKEELVFTDEDEEDEFEDKLEELDHESNDFGEEDSDDVKTNFNKHRMHINFDGKNMFSHKEHKKNSKIVTMLPFMDDEDLNEIVESIINGDDQYKDINLVVLFPFLKSQECERLFVKFLEDESKDNKKYITTLGPFVSTKFLSQIVDEYINGKYSNLNMNSLYPFMDKKDVKRVFQYVLKHNNFN